MKIATQHAHQTPRKMNSLLAGNSSSEVSGERVASLSSFRPLFWFSFPLRVCPGQSEWAANSVHAAEDLRGCAWRAAACLRRDDPVVCGEYDDGPGCIDAFADLYGNDGE